MVYQQLQDRVIQPIFYKNAVQLQPAVAVLVVLAGAQLAGILGALLAIPTAAALGVDLRRDLAAQARRRSGRRRAEPGPRAALESAGIGGRPRAAPASA